MEITRYIRRDRMDSDGFCQIHFRVCWSQRKIRFSSGQVVRPEETVEMVEIVTDPTTRKRKERKKLQTRNRKVNRILDTYSDCLHDFFDNYTGIPTEAEVQAEVERIRVEELNLVPKPAPTPEPEPVADPNKPPTLHEFWPRFAEDHKGILAAGYLRMFKSAGDHLKAFAPNADFQDVTLPFAMKFLQYLQSTGITDESAYNPLRKLRRVMKYARKCGINVPSDFEEFPYAKPINQREALTWSEIVMLQEAKLSPAMERQRDVFLFQCYCGLRWGDLIHVRPGNIREMMGDDEEITKVLRLVQEKGRKSNLLPLSEYALAILNKYDGVLPLLTNQKFNSSIKVFAKKAGLTRKVIKVVYREGKRYDEEYELWQVLSSHSGRHTFAMLMLELKMDITQVSDLMGHGSITTTMIYRTIRGEDAVREVKNAWSKITTLDPKRDPKK
ncbi:tyrosine-type recombinase/integrase [Larkinella arboricola]